ncbi:integrin alpha [Streptomyces sp. NPDC051684]
MIAARARFGASRAAFDADGDGCTDLVVGAPYEGTSPRTAPICTTPAPST